jgi:hypothetical protein
MYGSADPTVCLEDTETVMRIDPRLLNWGLFFILLGAIPLAVRQGLLAEASLERWWSLWPLLLVAAGIGLLLRRTPFDFAGGLLTAGTLGVMAGSVLATGFNVPDFAGCGDERGTTAFETREGTLSPGAEVRVELNCGDLDVVSGGGTGWRVEGVDEDGEGPRIDASAGELVVRSAEFRQPLGFLGKRDRWTITIPGTVGLDVSLAVNAGRGTIDLADGSFGRLAIDLNAGETIVDAVRVGNLDRLDVEVNAGSARLNLPGRALTANLSVNAGSIAFCTPDGVGLRVQTNDNITAGNNFSERGLTKSGSVWETAGFANADARIEIDAEANAGSITLNPDGGCDG